MKDLYYFLRNLIFALKRCESFREMYITIRVSIDGFRRREREK